MPMPLHALHAPCTASHLGSGALGSGTQGPDTAAPSADLLEDVEAVLQAQVMLHGPIGLLDYGVPEHLAPQIYPGKAVWVPLGRRRSRAYVTALKKEPRPSQWVLKDLLDVDEERPELPEAVVRVILFAAHYYRVSPGEMLETALPARARSVSARYRLTPAGHRLCWENIKEADRALVQVAARYPKGFTVATVKRILGIDFSQGAARIKKHLDKGWLEPLQRRFKPPQTLSYRRICSLLEGQKALTARQKGAWGLLKQIPADQPMALETLVAQDANARTRLKTLERLNLVECLRQPWGPRLPQEADPDALLQEALVSTVDQQALLTTLHDHVARRVFSAFLLHGVTGSGKTEVYLQTIAYALQEGRSALVLVPEIALTSQLGERFQGRFGHQVAVFHSGLTAADRRNAWERVAAGAARIGLGARSALFLPLRHVGVIIVDEEHEASFKQDESPRYHARDLAVLRARQEQAVVILGSATPSLESYCNAQSGRYGRLLLPSRVHGQPLPPVECLDLKQEKRVGGGSLTLPLAQALEKTLAQGQQAILFLNRRGFAPYVYCRACGHSYRCEACDVSLTLHQKRNILLCHYCGFETPAPQQCCACQSTEVGAFGLGIERLEEEIQTRVGAVPMARLDRDTVRNKADLERVLKGFRSGGTQILLGTQMVAKGHDFPGVTLVGVICADASLNFPDFRAAERTFQLLTQVAGRAGRGHRLGQVLIQTYEKDHYAIRAACAHDYGSFVAQELQARQALDYPPFSWLALLRFEGPVEAAARDAARHTGETLRGGIQRHAWPVGILGPAAAPLARLRGLWRFHILLKAKTRKALRMTLASLPKQPRDPVRRILDVDPVSML